MLTVFFAGSFNPFTRGHADILNRLLAFADKVIVGIGVNADKAEISSTAAKNAEAIRKYVSSRDLADRIKVITYTGLTALKAREEGADCLARGIRNAGDFDYEYSLAAANRNAFGIETILMPADPALSYVSSSLIRDLKSNGKEDIAKRYLAE